MVSDKSIYAIFLFNTTCIWNVDGSYGPIHRLDIDMRTIARWIAYGSVYAGVSLINALVELYTAFRSILMCIQWMVEGCVNEYTVEDENGEIIHHFPQINFRD